MGWVSTVFNQSHAMQGSVLFHHLYPDQEGCSAFQSLLTYECFQVYYVRSKEPGVTVLITKLLVLL